MDPLLVLHDCVLGLCVFGLSGGILLSLGLLLLSLNGGSSRLLRAETSLPRGSSRSTFTIDLDLAEVFNVCILDLEELLWVLNGLVDRWVEEVRAIAKVSVDLFQSGVEEFHSVDDFSLATLQLCNLLVEVNFKLVD